MGVRVKWSRGLKANLPITGADGTWYYTTDTNELFYGVALTKANAADVTSVAGKTGVVTLNESDINGLVADLAAEASARTSGDSATLATAEGYTDSSIATEVTNRNTALGVETARAEAAESTLTTAVAGKQASLGFTPENIANKDTAGTLGTSDTHYPSQKAVKTYVDAETTRAESAEAVLTSAVSAETTRAEAAEASKSSLLEYQFPNSNITGNGSSQTLFTATIPGGAIPAGRGVRIKFKIRQHGSTSTSYGVTFGGTTLFTWADTNNLIYSFISIDVMNQPGSTTAQQVHQAWVSHSTAIQAFSAVTDPAVNTANPVVVTLAFSVASSVSVDNISMSMGLI